DASDIYVSTPGAALSGPEVLLAATNRITVTDGSVVRAEGARIADGSPLLLDGDGALLRVSTGDRVPLVRSDSTGARGILSVGAASLSGNSLALDGTSNVLLSGSSRISTKQFDLASARINLGDVPSSTPGVAVTSDALAQLASGTDLLLRGYDSIQL